jgi:tetratricopeptide (TPR) repeat protein
VDPRRLALAIVSALVVAGVVVGLALAQRSPESKQVATTCGKPFPGLPVLSFDLPQRYATPLAEIQSTGFAKTIAKLRALGSPNKDPNLALALTQAEYNAGHVAPAKADLLLAAARLGGDDTRVTVAGALIAWPTTSPSDVARTLEGIANDAPSSDGLPLVERGIVSLWQGCTATAATWLEQAKGAEPDSFYSTLADNLLHPEQNKQYPPFISNVKLPGGGVAERKRAAAAHPGSADLQLAYALALQGAGKRTAARAAAEQAVAADPRNLDAQVAAIVLGYDKDAPATAVGALGALIKQNPDQVGPVLHLGILLLWIERNTLAAQEFAKAAKISPTSRDGRIASAFLAGLKKSSG